MTTTVERFFTAWAIADDSERDAQVKETLDAHAFYVDPRTQAPLTEAGAIMQYVGQFSKMAPGMPVAVTGMSTTLDFVRATVRFGEGEHSQLGQYTCELNDEGKLVRLIGFTGTGAPE